MPKMNASLSVVVENVLYREFGRSQVTPEMRQAGMVVVHKVRRDLADYYRRRIRGFKSKLQYEKVSE